MQANSVSSITARLAKVFFTTRKYTFASRAADYAALSFQQHLNHDTQQPLQIVASLATADTSVTTACFCS